MHACDVHCTYVRSLEYHRQHRSSPWFTSPISRAHTDTTQCTDTLEQHMYMHLGERCRNLLLRCCIWLFFFFVFFSSYLRCKMIRARFELCMLCMSLAHFQSSSYCSATQKFYAIPTTNVTPPLLEYGFDFYIRLVHVWCFFSFHLKYIFAFLRCSFLVVFRESKVYQCLMSCSSSTRALHVNSTNRATFWSLFIYMVLVVFFFSNVSNHLYSLLPVRFFIFIIQRTFFITYISRFRAVHRNFRSIEIYLLSIDVWCLSIFHWLIDWMEEGGRKMNWDDKNIYMQIRISQCGVRCAEFANWKFKWSEIENYYVYTATPR